MDRLLKIIISLLDGATPRAMVFLSHGFSEHLGLYKEIGAFLGMVVSIFLPEEGMVIRVRACSL